MRHDRWPALAPSWRFSVITATVGLVQPSGLDPAFAEQALAPEPSPEHGPERRRPSNGGEPAPHLTAPHLAEVHPLAEPIAVAPSSDRDGVERPLSLHEGRLLGHVASVDADRVLVRLVDEAAVASVSVSDLVAMPAANGFLIGIVEGLGCGQPAEEVAARIMPVGTLGPAPGESATFRLGAAHHPHIRAGCHLVDGERVSRFMSILGSDVAADERLVLGRYLADSETEAIADANHLLQRHLAILGNTGSGKSWAVARLVERAARLQHANLIVLDTHGEYGPLSCPNDEGTQVARRLRIAGQADSADGADDVMHLPFWLLQGEELMALVLNERDPFAPDQRLWLTDRVQALKRAAIDELGDYEAVATVTADSPVAYPLQQLLDWLQRDQFEKIVQQPSGDVEPGPFAGKLGGLISRFETCRNDPRYDFIFHPPAYTETQDWLGEMALKLLEAGAGAGGVKIIDVSELPTSIVPLVVGALARLIYDIQFWMEPERRTPICLVCDEAHVYMREGADQSAIHRGALSRFEMIAEEGRKYGVCLAVVSQRPSEVSRTVLSQCNNFIVMRLTNDRDHALIVQLVPGAFAGVAALLPMLDVGEAVVLGDALLLPVRIKLDPPASRPDSRTIPYWSEWSQKPSSRDAIVTGVGAMRRQWRGTEAAD